MLENLDWSVAVHVAILRKLMLNEEWCCGWKASSCLIRSFPNNCSPHGRTLLRELSLAMMYDACPRRHSNYSLSSRCVQFRAHKIFKEGAEHEACRSTRRFQTVCIRIFSCRRDMAIEKTMLVLRDLGGRLLDSSVMALTRPSQ